MRRIGEVQVDYTKKHEAETKYDLGRFIKAHEEDYGRALSEVKAGCKRTHWMWYIFPQIIG